MIVFRRLFWLAFWHWLMPTTICSLRSNVFALWEVVVDPRWTTDRRWVAALPVFVTVVPSKRRWKPRNSVSAPWAAVDRPWAVFLPASVAVKMCFSLRFNFQFYKSLTLNIRLGNFGYKMNIIFSTKLSFIPLTRLIRHLEAKIFAMQIFA